MELLRFSKIKEFISLLNSAINFVGISTRNTYWIIYYILRAKINKEHFIHQSALLVFNGIMPVFMIAIALGVVLGIQLGPEFVSRGLGNKLGILSAITMTRELIPVVGSLMIATQYGTGIAAEIANMKITEQVDALKVFRVDPISYLVVPRFLAAVCFLPVINWLASVVAVLSTFAVLRIEEGIRFNGFISSIWDYFNIDDIMLCVYKSSIFGAIIVITAITLGLETKGGAKEVGRTTTMTVILSFIYIVFFDYIITSIYL